MVGYHSASSWKEVKDAIEQFKYFWKTKSNLQKATQLVAHMSCLYY